MPRFAALRPCLAALSLLACSSESETASGNAAGGAGASTMAGGAAGSAVATGSRGAIGPGQPGGAGAGLGGGDSSADSGGAATGATGGAGTGGTPTAGGQGGTGRGGVGGAFTPVDPPEVASLIDDMEDEDGAILPIGGRIGAWYTFNDGSGGSQTPAPDSPGFDMSPAGRAGSSFAVNTLGSGFSDWGAGVGFDLNNDDVSRTTYDASEYDGLTFWARAGTGTPSVRLNVVDQGSDPAGGVCSACNDHFGADLTLRAEWQRFAVTWGQLRKIGFGDPRSALDPSALYAVQFQVGTNVSFDLWIDDIAFVKVDAPPVASGSGFLPSSVTPADAANEYASWKGAYVEDCGGGVSRVRFTDPSQTVSEGIAYGMLLAVTHDDRTLFDGLWQYYLNNRNDHGVMHWRRSGCGGRPRGDNGATDAELDAAMALIMASCRWPDLAPTHDYAADAASLVSAIRTWETTTSGNLTLLKPGDYFGGDTCLNYSYFAPGYYRAFAAVEPAQSGFWLDLAADTYTVLARAAHGSTGLVPNWGDVNGSTSFSGPVGCNWYQNADWFGYDAVRAPWRIATDYLWWGTGAAKTHLDPITDWVEGLGIANTGDGYLLDGTQVSQNHSAIFVGAFATAAIAYDQSRVEAFASELMQTGASDYYGQSLRALYLAMLAGMFWPTCGS